MHTKTCNYYTHIIPVNTDTNTYITLSKNRRFFFQTQKCVNKQTKDNEVWVQPNKTVLKTDSFYFTIINHYLYKYKNYDIYAFN